MQRLLAATAGIHQLVFRLLYGTGMRKMECLRLRVKDLDFDRRLIVIRRTTRSLFGRQTGPRAPGRRDAPVGGEEVPAGGRELGVVLGVPVRP